MSEQPILTLEGLHVGYPDVQGGVRWAVEDVSLSVAPRDRVGIVGESGSGKSSLALASLGLAHGATVTGAVSILGRRYEPTLRGMRSIRGSVAGLVLQDPLSALNPVVPLGRQLEEVLVVRGVRRGAARARALELLDRVGVARAAERLHAYPHEFSGGMRQRVVIAMALMASPSLLVADEPTTALDLRTQRKVLDLILELCRERDMALVIISHDIDVIADMAERIVVLYAAQAVEFGVTGDVLRRPAHPYTAGLLASRADLEGPVPERLASISGSPPGPGNLSGCCRFAPRCDFATERCRAEAPGLRNVALQGPLVPNGPEGAGGEHLAACHFSEMFLKGELIGMTSPEAVGPRAGAGPELGEGADLVVDVSALVKHYGRPSDRGGEVVALSNVSLSIRRGEALGVVGESGSGKSTLARCLAGLTAPTSGSLTVSGMSWQGRLSDRERRQLAKKVQLVFQDPYASLNPRMKVGDLVGEGLKVHGLEPSRSARSTRVEELLVRVGLDGELSDRSPRQLSGGQRRARRNSPPRWPCNPRS